jgi:hypothetical protein
MIEKGGKEYEIIKAFYDEFLNGVEDQKDFDQHQQLLLRIEQVMKENYNWTDLIPPLWLGAHECSDMILSAGNYGFKFQIFFVLFEFCFQPTILGYSWC